jgi:hypothetical protein
MLLIRGCIECASLSALLLLVNAYRLLRTDIRKPSHGNGDRLQGTLGLPTRVCLKKSGFPSHTPGGWFCWESKTICPRTLEKLELVRKRLFTRVRNWIRKGPKVEYWRSNRAISRLSVPRSRARVILHTVTRRGSTLENQTAL